MNELNYNIIRVNVNMLMKNKHLTQTELADVLDMSQSNLSKALSEKDKKYFTLEQLYEISEYFGVSLDWLTGRTVSNDIDISEKNIARFFAALLSKRIIKTGLPSNVETVYGPNPNESGTPAYTPYDENLPKETFYFPNQLNLRDYKGEDYKHAVEQFETEGNDAPGKAVNKFFENYLPILELYMDGKFNDNIHQVILDTYLKEM